MGQDRVRNLFADLPHQAKDELVDVLAEASQLRIERIVSTGQSSPPGFWYDQTQHEWVVVLSGEALVRFEDDDTEVHLKPGDHVLIHAHRKHRVQWTAPDQPTVWLAVFFSE